MNHLIGLAGYAQSGKDSLAKYLIEDHGYTQMSFAQPLKDAVYTLNPIIGGARVSGAGPFRLAEYVDEVGWDEAKKVSEVRRLLQVMGTEVGREIISPTCWVDIARRKCCEVAALGGRIVFTDVRFPNEVEMIRNLDGDLYRVQRPGIDAVNRHVSETAIDHVTMWTVHNDKDIEELRTVATIIGTQGVPLTPVGE